MERSGTFDDENEKDSGIEQAEVFLGQVKLVMKPPLCSLFCKHRLFREVELKQRRRSAYSDQKCAKSIHPMSA